MLIDILPIIQVVLPITVQRASFSIKVSRSLDSSFAFYRFFFAHFLLKPSSRLVLTVSLNQHLDQHRYHSDKFLHPTVCCSLHSEVRSLRPSRVFFVISTPSICSTFL